MRWVIINYAMIIMVIPKKQKRFLIKWKLLFIDTLKSQLLMLNLDDRQKKIAEQIIGSIDDDGYLRREISAIADDLAFRQNIDSTEKEIEEIIRLIQQFDPPGVAARNLRRNVFYCN